MLPKSGDSTGSFTFVVSSASNDKVNLTITSGSFTVNGTTYTVTSGNLVLSEDGESGYGSGKASGGATFQIHVAGIHDNNASTASVGAIKLHVEVGKSAYLVILNPAEGEDQDSGGD